MLGFTSLSGGNMVDGLPAAISLEGYGCISELNLDNCAVCIMMFLFVCVDVWFAPA